MQYTTLCDLAMEGAEIDETPSLHTEPDSEHKEIIHKKNKMIFDEFQSILLA